LLSKTIYTLNTTSVYTGAIVLMCMYFLNINDNMLICDNSIMLIYIY